MSRNAGDQPDLSGEARAVTAAVRSVGTAAANPSRPDLAAARKCLVMVCLAAPDVRFEASYREAMAEFVAEDRAKELRSLPNHATFASFVRELHEQSRGRGLPKDWVAGTAFWLVDGDAFIGKVEVRHRLTDALRLRGGHVGYSIRATMRHRGYGTLALTLVLPRCLDLGLDRILVTCDVSNEASRRIIESNGGELQDLVHLDDRPTPTMRFWIDVPAQCRSESSDT